MNKSLFRLLCALLLLTDCLLGSAQSHSAIQPKALPKSFYDWLSTPSMRHATVALEVVRLPQQPALHEPTVHEPAIDRGRVIYSYDAERMVTPASVLKLLTAATGFRLLGRDYVWPDSIPMIDTAAVALPGLEYYNSDWLIEDIDTEYMPPLSNLLPDSGRVLGDVMHETLLHSLNPQAETMLRLLTPSCRLDSSLVALQNYWQHRGIDLSGLAMYDGCGLSPSDRVTAHLVNSVLADMQFDDDFRQSIALVSREGTVRRFLLSTRLEARGRLKTGTLKNVVAYAGYLTGSDGRTYAVSFLVNNSTGPKPELRKSIEKQLLSLIP